MSKRSAFNGGLVTIMTVACALAAACGSSKSGKHAGLGGGGAAGTQALGGMTGTGGIVVSGGITNPVSSAPSGGAGAGGTGNDSRVTGDAGVYGGSSGGAGAGGMATTGAGGLGGGSALDAGSSDAPVATCDKVATQDACDARPDCHSVFAEAAGCSCDGGACCMRFSRCAPGGKPDCTDPAACNAIPPNCPAPYAVAYSGGCPEGCALASACPTPACPAAAPANATPCGPVSVTCVYESCSTTGRTQATCAGGTWKTQNSACTTVPCRGPNGSTTTCAAGKVCLVQEVISGAWSVTLSCVDHTCGTGPITLQCVPGGNGKCGMSQYDLSGAIKTCTSQTCGYGTLPLCE